MAPYTVTYILVIGLLVGLLVVVARLIAIKFGKDPIMRRLDPKSSEYAAHKKLQQSRRFTVALFAALLGLLAVAVLVVLETRAIVKLDTPESRSLLFFGPAVAIIGLALSFWLAYYQLIGGQRK
jgi:hypothetical protein